MGEGNVFSLFTSGEGGSVQVGGVSPAGGGEGWVSPAWGGGQSSQEGGGVSILRPFVGGMALAFTQEDFLVF